jgi:hypothetical protein
MRPHGVRSPSSAARRWLPELDEPPLCANPAKTL